MTATLKNFILSSTTTRNELTVRRARRLTTALRTVHPVRPRNIDELINILSAGFHIKPECNSAGP